MNHNSIRLTKALLLSFSSPLSNLVDCFLRNDVAKSGNRGSSCRLISCYHYHLHTCWSAFQDSKRYGVSWWISEGKDSHKAKTFIEQILFFNVHVEFVSSWESALGKMHLGKSQHSLSPASKSSVNLIEFLLPLRCQRNRFSSNINVFAPIPDFFRSTFQEYTVLRVWSLVLIDWVGKFEGRIEGESNLFVFITSCNGKLWSDLLNISQRLEEFDQPWFRSITCSWHFKIQHSF